MCVCVCVCVHVCVNDGNGCSEMASDMRRRNMDSDKGNSILMNSSVCGGGVGARMQIDNEGNGCSELASDMRRKNMD